LWSTGALPEFLEPLRHYEKMSALRTVLNSAAAGFGEPEAAIPFTPPPNSPRPISPATQFPMPNRVAAAGASSRAQDAVDGGLEGVRFADYYTGVGPQVLSRKVRLLLPCNP